MTVVKYKAEQGVYTLEADGHATGDQNVCAAVSTLTQTLLGYLLNLERAGEANVLQRRFGDGYVFVEAEGKARCRDAFELIWFGFCQLSRSFPKQVSAKK